MLKKNKKRYILIAIILLIAVGGGIAIHNHNNNSKAEETITSETSSPAATPTATPEETTTVEQTQEPQESVQELLQEEPVTEVVNDPYIMKYWVNMIDPKSELIADQSRIHTLNELSYTTKGTKLFDLRKAALVIKGDELIQLIQSYEFPSKSYLNGVAIKSEDVTAIKKQQNIDQINKTEEMSVQYGLITSNAAVRSFPTEASLTQGNGVPHDYLQESMFYVNEGVVIYSESKDGNWYFVQGTNYYGWIKKDKVGICDYTTMISYHFADSFVTVLDQQEVNGTELRMGTYLKLVSEQKNSYQVSIPKRADDGSCSFTVVEVPTTGGYYKGYLPYTTEEILNQAEKLIGTPYGWGDKNGMDCSSTLNSIYRCFGFVMPRNTSNQKNIPAGIHKVSGMSQAKKLEVLSNCRPGSLLFIPGHVMMYLGNVDGEPYIVHNFTGYKNTSGKMVNYYSCAITKLALGVTGDTYLDRLTEILEIE